MSGSLVPVPPGHVAAIVTYLEMTKRPGLSPAPPSPLRLERWDAVDPARYRDLFRRVGGRWLWYSRLAMSDSELLDKAGIVYEVLGPSGASVGMLELDFRAGKCMILFLGLVPEIAGQGHGRWLFAETLRLAWAPGIEEVRVHTCSLDHPAALPSYLKAGFTAVGRAFESFPDPRLAGLLPDDVAPQLPMIG